MIAERKLGDAFEALLRDLTAEGGPRISAVRSYRFAILPYDPGDEFIVRRHVHSLSHHLRADRGWGVLSLNLGALMLERLRREGEGFMERAIAAERRLFTRDPERAFNQLRDRLGLVLDGPDGLVADIVAQIDHFADARADTDERTLIWLGRCGALYPFVRTSALLKHLDGRTRHLPVVLLYPGVRRDASALSFMGELEADRDYRPRIY